MADEMDLIDVSLNLLKVVGAHPNQNKKSMFMVVANNGIRFTFVFLMVWMMAENMNDVNALMDGIESLSAFLQGIMKLLPILLFRDNLKQLIYGIRYFSKQQYKQLGNFNGWRKALSLYKSFVYSTYAAIIAVSIVNKDLGFACHVPDFPHAFFVLFVGQYLQLTIDTFIVIGIDLFFISVCLVIKRQFLKLEIEFSELDQEKEELILKRKLQVCIHKHVYLLNYSQLLSDAYSYTLLLQYIISTYSICIELYILTEGNNVSDVVQGGFYILTLLFQLALYCFPAEEVTQTASKVSLSIYSNNWYKYPVHIQKNISNIICRAQQPLLIMAGDMLVINREAFTTIFRGSLSFYTLVKQMKDK